MKLCASRSYQVIMWDVWSYYVYDVWIMKDEVIMMYDVWIMKDEVIMMYDVWIMKDEVVRFAQ